MGKVAVEVVEVGGVSECKGRTATGLVVAATPTVYWAKLPTNVA
jgi:hypothetical protein